MPVCRSLLVIVFADFVLALLNSLLIDLYAKMTAQWALHMSASNVPSQTRTRVKLNKVFFVRFLVSPKFPHVPLGIDGWPLGYEERRCWANCPCSWLPRFPTYVITIHQRHRGTDGQHAIARPCTVCTIVHRAVKTTRELPSTSCARGQIIIAASCYDVLRALCRYVRETRHQNDR